MAGITIQKNYVSSSLVSATLTNNWMVLVLGVTSRGPVTPTLVQTYANFEKQFGQPVKGVVTHPYVQMLLNSGVPVLFKRVTDDTKIANYAFVNSASTELFTVSATNDFIGTAGENIWVKFVEDTSSGNSKYYMNIYYTSEQPKDDTIAVEQYFIGTKTDSISFDALLYSFISKASGSFDSQYVTIRQIDNDFDANWKNAVKGIIDQGATKLVIIPAATDVENNSKSDAEKAIDILMDYSNSFWKDRKLKNSSVYYPQLRFITSGGLVTSDVEPAGEKEASKITAYHQNTINHNLGKFAVDCGLNFRALIDYSMDMTDISVVRQFAETEAAGTTVVKTIVKDSDPPVVYKASYEPVAPSVYAYFGYWGADTNNNWLPGSAGFLSALGLSGYNVYSRRVAGSSFTPAFVKPYSELYIDVINDWQNEEEVQVNPIVNIDVQDNLAVMGSSTLALPLSSISARNPAQALDIVLVGDYVTNILHNIALGELESALDRLSLNSLSNRMSQEVEKFVTSRAITKYDFTFDTTQLGKLGINCTLYFAVGLEEVELTVTSVYDTTAITQ